MTTRKRTIAVTAMAALGLSSLSPVQQGAALMAAGATALWASPALAQVGVPGVGIVVKKKPGNAPIIVPSDAKGGVRLSGLEPGDYSVQVFGSAEETAMNVGPDGALAFTAWQDIKGATSPTPVPNPRADGRRNPPPLPVVRRWAEQIAFASNPAAPPPPGASNPTEYCPNGPSCGWNVLDLNTNSADKIARATGTSMQSAVQIVVLREKGGPYTSIEDFARRNCPTSVIEMNQGVVKIGEATFLLAPQAGKPVTPGFQCAPRSGGQFSLYGRRHNYVGHVTLLR